VLTHQEGLSLTGLVSKEGVVGVKRDYSAGGLALRGSLRAAVANVSGVQRGAAFADRKLQTGNARPDGEYAINFLRAEPSRL
jgi:hypothetical protein